MKRKTLAGLSGNSHDLDAHSELADRGMRRYHPFSFDFDSTPLSLDEPDQRWDDHVKQLHMENRALEIKRLEEQYGTRRIEDIVKNAGELGPKSMSLLTYHNELHEQARRAFVACAYYPALVAACALGERILNHLVLDLRAHFKSSEHYGKISRKDSFDDWPYGVRVLTDWRVLADGVGVELLALHKLRNQSIHFNPDTYGSLRADALAALQRLGSIIEKQFGYFGKQPWFIENTPGAQFIKRNYEAEPFVRTYLLRKSALVGPLFGMEFTADGHWNHLDYDDYGSGELNDNEFAKLYRERGDAVVMTREMIDGKAEKTG